MRHNSQVLSLAVISVSFLKVLCADSPEINEVNVTGASSIIITFFY